MKSLAVLGIFALIGLAQSTAFAEGRAGDSIVNSCDVITPVKLLPRELNSMIAAGYRVHVVRGSYHHERLGKSTEIYKIKKSKRVLGALNLNIEIVPKGRVDSLVLPARFFMLEVSTGTGSGSHPIAIATAVPAYLAGNKTFVSAYVHQADFTNIPHCFERQ